MAPHWSISPNGGSPCRGSTTPAPAGRSATPLDLSLRLMAETVEWLRQRAIP